MKKLLCIVFSLMLVLCSCKQPDAPATEPSVSTDVFTQASQTESVDTTEQATESTPPVSTEPAHSELYLTDVSTEQMVHYFNEVVLSMEYTDGSGEVSLVQKWTQPICYRISGAPTDEDLLVLEELFTQLNEVEGFPGIYSAGDEDMGNLTISFLDANDFQVAFSDFLRGEEADGAVQFWYYTASNEIYDGRIGYRTDINQEIRNSVILEEVINLLGINDTVLREDSIVYQYSSEATQLSDTDWVLLKLLYHPDIQCGMNAEDCRQVLEQLYY